MNTTLTINPIFQAFVEQELLPNSTVSPELFWQTLSQLLTTFIPRNQALLAERDRLQQVIDDWHKQHPNFHQSDYQTFLKTIGYLKTEPENFMISVDKVDPEISTIAGPQLVVPVDNARYAINAVNARFGSLYDALYGTDMINNEGNLAKTSTYNNKRGEVVFCLVHQFLDNAIPLKQGCYDDIIGFSLNHSHDSTELTIATKQGNTNLKKPTQWIGYRYEKKLTSLIFKHHDLHIILVIDNTDPIGQQHPAYIKDVLLESAVTTILDLEDSVVCVDAEDKVNAYRNVLGLMQGTLSVKVTKNNHTFERQLNDDYCYTDITGQGNTLSSRSLMLLRNVGIHIWTDIISTTCNNTIPEGILDAMVSGIMACHDGNNVRKNSQYGSFYIVKPKLHSADEVAFMVYLLDAIEQAFQLSKNTLKIGIMDEERRISINLKACIKAAKDRVIFINTGFLDRTGDEIHTSMQAGAFLPKSAIKQQVWLDAYETQNVKIGLDCGFSGKAQIGKGMWAMPDQMQAMMATKINHLKAGALCAWVPSPTAATLHAMHYHQIPVLSYQKTLTLDPKLSNLLTIALLTAKTCLTSVMIQQELDNNIQGILGYTVHWVDAGIGCSKVPDIHHIGLMEDRATLRISSQHVANWLHHHICSKTQVDETFYRMAKVVDKQNINTHNYQPMSTDYKGLAFLAAKALVYEGMRQPNGYTEFILTHYRHQAKITV